MSRRTKLTITAIFLVLLAIPIGYVGLTWTAKSPPRIRYLGQGEPVMRRYEGSIPAEQLMIPVRFEVENPSYIPLHIQKGTWSYKGSLLMSGEVFLDFLFQREIPAGGVIRGEAYATRDQVRYITGQEMVVYCEWDTLMKRRASRLLRNAARRLDSSFLHEMSVFDMMIDAIPVEDASATPGASGSSTGTAP